MKFGMSLKGHLEVGPLCEIFLLTFLPFYMLFKYWDVFSLMGLQVLSIWHQLTLKTVLQETTS